MPGVDRRMTIVIPAAARASARTASAAVDTTGSSGMFLAPLSPSGNGPATHYWASWQLTPAQYTQLQGLLQSQALINAGVQVFDDATMSPSQILNQLGLQRLRTP